MENRFDDIHNKPVIDHLVKLLDISTWPLSDDDELFGDDAANGVTEYIHDLLELRMAVLLKIFQLNGRC